MARRKKKKSPSLFSIIILLLFIFFLGLYIYSNYINNDIDNEPNKPNNIVDDNKEVDKDNNSKEETPIIQDKEPVNKDKEKEPIEDNKPNNVVIENYTPKYLGNITNSSGVTIKSGWETLITKYLDLYYKSLINLEVEDITSLFTDANGNEAYLTQNATKLLVEHHKLQENNLSLTNAKYDIKYMSVNINNNIVTIKFKKNETLKFKYLYNIESKSYDMDNTIVIRKTNDNYTIDSIRVVQDYYIMYTNEVNTSNSNAKTQIDNLTSKYLTNSRQEVNKNKELKTNVKYEPTKKYDHPYDRIKAKEYTKEYVNKRNEKFTAYDNSGGNCMNFASQVLNAGGIPMDYIGDYQWKHYSSSLNENNTAAGRSASWVSTNSFYEYAKNNTGFGLVSEVDINLFAGEVGDIIQVGYNGYSHTAVISSVITNNDNEVIDLLINCNTLSLENYPLSAYVYQNKRLIKILGYND